MKAVLITLAALAGARVVHEVFRRSFWWAVGA